MSGRAYDSLRSIVERHGGSMVYEREGYRHGAWVITVGKDRLTLDASGKSSFPELDRLHVPSVPHPKHWDDYSDVLVPDAEERLLAMVRHGAAAPGKAVPDLSRVIERARWKFAWTYARIYPHEYTTKVLCQADDHALLIDSIERYGTVERFGKDHRKYLYFGERKYWHMGEFHSADPENRPNVINRTWVDVRRHAENVKHRWTPEEVELQKRLWEIQLEKSTDRPRRSAKR